MADGVVLLTLAGSEAPSCQPGAHIDLHLGDYSLVRQFSLCSSPADLTTYQVAVLREPHGRGGSSFVHDCLAVEDEVGIGGPRNNFDQVDASRYLFIAGGIGITPSRADDRGREPSGSRLESRVRRPHRRIDGLHLPPHRHRRPASPPQAPRPVRPSRHQRPPVGARPRYPDLLLRTRAAARRSPGSLRPLARRFPARGALRRPRHRRGGWHGLDLRSGAGPERHHRDRSARGIDRRCRRSSRGPVIYSCQEGTCGSCEVAVLGGEPDHRDSILSEAERESGKSMMICVSRAKSDRIVLDL